MLVGVNLKSNKTMSIKNKILEFKNPEYVYIPLVNHTNLNCESLVKKGDKVYKGSIIGIRKDHFEIPIHSSVSGKVVGIEERPYLNGKLVNCVVIENDFKEKVEYKKVPKKNIANYSKKEFIEILKNCGIVGMGGSGFPTYVKYDTEEEINTIIINGVECEPYITADYVLMREKAEELLECLDAIMEINNIKQGIIVIKVGHEVIKEEFEKYIGTYPNIKLVEVKDIYPMGWEKYIIKTVLNITYDKLPIEKNIVVNNVSTFYAIYEALKYNKPVIEKMITVTGSNIKKPQNVIVKIGSTGQDIINFIGGYNEKNKIKFIAGGPMMGTTINSDDLVVSNNLNCILVMDDYETDPLINCMRCGRCVSVCPVKISPVLIKYSLNNPEKIKEYHPEKCIECGLCSYICPSKIEVREYVKKAKELR
jgi:electron transport complex protein RnfC